MKKSLELFLSIFKIGTFTFGGGYAMLPFLQREVVEKRAWATHEELTDYFAIGQCTPGIIAVNTATFIGYKLKSYVGGVVATLGLVFPCLVIIMLIAAFIQNFADLPVVIHAFNGVRACVCALILSSVLKLRKSTVVDGATLAADLLGTEELPPLGEGRDLMVTPKDIDSQVADLSKVIGYGIDLALQPSLTLEDLDLLLS